MPVHDWTKVDAEILHDFHLTWMVAMHHVMNQRLLPDGCYALVEQHERKSVDELITIFEEAQPDKPDLFCPITGGIDAYEYPAQVDFTETAEIELSRSLAISHEAGHRLFALLEIVSPSNKDRKEYLRAFARKAVTTIKKGIHLLVIDLFPPGKHDPRGIHGIIRRKIGMSKGRYDLTSEEPFTLASYAAGE